MNRIAASSHSAVFYKCDSPQQFEYVEEFYQNEIEEQVVPTLQQNQADLQQKYIELSLPIVLSVLLLCLHIVIGRCVKKARVKKSGVLAPKKANRVKKIDEV